MLRLGILPFTDTPDLNDLRYEGLPLGIGGVETIEDAALTMLDAAMTGFRRGDKTIDRRILRRCDTAVIQQLLLVFLDLRERFVAAVLDGLKGFFVCASHRA